MLNLEKIAVIARGKVELLRAFQFAREGHKVVGVDVNLAVVDLVSAGHEPFLRDGQLQEKLTEFVAVGRPRTSIDHAEAVPGADAVVLVVPLIVVDDANPEFASSDAAPPWTPSFVPVCSPKAPKWHHSSGNSRRRCWTEGIMAVNSGTGGCAWHSSQLASAPETRSLCPR